jgi:hypothetical protein
METTVFTMRCDKETKCNLKYLTKHYCENQSDAVRNALRLTKHLFEIKEKHGSVYVKKGDGFVEIKFMF